MINPAAEEILDDRPFWRRWLEAWFPEKFGPKNRYVCIRIDKDRGPVCYFCSETRKTLYSEIPNTGLRYDKTQDNKVEVNLEYYVLGRLLKYRFVCTREEAKRIFNYDAAPVRSRKKRKK